MPNVFIVVITLLIALEASAQTCLPLNVGCCITIETKYPRTGIWKLYDKGSDHWAYLDNKVQKDKSHQWKVIERKGNVYKFESVAFPKRCLCEKTNLVKFFGATCPCESNAPGQLWELEGVEKGNRVTFKRPNYWYFLYPCKNGLCLQVDPDKYYWYYQPC